MLLSLFQALPTLPTTWRRKDENSQPLSVIQKYCWIVGVVVREHNISGVPCKDYIGGVAEWLGRRS